MTNNDPMTFEAPMVHNNLCIIPARGGSKRIPRKNIKDFLGKPIIAYSIEAALKCKLFDEVMVSTDDQEIAEIARNYGASVPFLRSKVNSNDFAGTADVLIEVLDQYSDIGKSFEYLCCIYPTAPLINPEKLKKGFEQIVVNKNDTVFPIVEFSYPIWRGLKLENNGKTSMVWPENMHKRSQDLENTFHDAGQWYWFNIDSFRREKKLWMNNTAGMVLDQIEVQDIDNLTDWKLAELKYAYLQSIK